jgi:hypothetical protein
MELIDMAALPVLHTGGARYAVSQPPTPGQSRSRDKASVRVNRTNSESLSARCSAADGRAVEVEIERQASHALPRNGCAGAPT